jgi:hypothetical protein
MMITFMKNKAVPKKASHVLELSDGSDDNEESNDMPDVDSDDDDKVTEIAAESAEAELSKFKLLEYYVLKVFNLE